MIGRKEWRTQMPMPHGTYIQAKKIEKIRLRATQSNQRYREHVSSIKKPSLRKFNISSARNTAYLARDLGPESSNKGNKFRKALAELVDQLNDMSEQIETLSDQFAELREPHFEYRAATHTKTNITTANVLHIAMACITLLMALEKVLFGKSNHRV